MRLCLALAALLLIAAGPPPDRLYARAPGGRTMTLLAARGKQAWTVTVMQTDQRITAQAEGDTLPDAPPLLMPLASPEMDDLLLPVLLGNVNLVWDVWLQDARSGRFTPAGQLSGIDVARDRSGAIVTLARSSCCEWTYSVWRTGADRQLVEAFEIDAPLQESGRIRDCTPTSEDGKPMASPPDPAMVARLCRKGEEPALHE
jgi:hypothetical protein